MLVGVPKEIKDNEKRVAITPNVVTKIKKLGYDILVENDLGLKKLNPSFEKDVIIPLPSSLREYTSELSNPFLFDIFE